MIKKIVIVIFLVFVFRGAKSQDVIELISTHICNCIDTIENMDSLEVKFDRCMNESIEVFWNSDDDEQLEHWEQSDTIRNAIDSVMTRFILYCPQIRAFLIEEKESEYYKLSQKKEANKYYEEGVKAFEAGDFKNAEKHFLKAIKTDSKFVYAYDNLALTYKRLNQADQAKLYYQKSLDIFPEGKVALQNQADLFINQKDYMSALTNYNSIINLYPEDAEGYYGIARILFLNEDYEKALDYTFIAHRIYTLQGSEYVKDTEKLFSMIREKMKEEGKEDEFNSKAKELGI